MLTPESLLDSINVDAIAVTTYAAVRSAYRTSPFDDPMPDEYIASAGLCKDVAPRMTRLVQARLSQLGILGLRAYHERHEAQGDRFSEHEYVVVDYDSNSPTSDGRVVDLTYRQLLLPSVAASARNVTCRVTRKHHGTYEYGRLCKRTSV